MLGLRQQPSSRALGLFGSLSGISAALALLAAGALFLSRGLLYDPFTFFAQFTHAIRTQLLPGCELLLSFLPLRSCLEPQRVRTQPEVS
jgi:hypothetical protein